jgi:hypothetical protein
MIKNVLIISSNRTGYGHASISVAISEEFTKRNVNVQVVDGFAFAGNLGLMFSNLYGTLIRWAKPIY